MTRGIRRLRRFCSPQKWLAALALLNYLALALGIPLPVEMAAPSDGKPFPCAQHRCGCTNAEACWRSCCCMTMTEKLAWSKRNGIEPPAFVLALAQLRSGAAAEHHGDCCKSAHKAVCSTSAKAPTGSAVPKAPTAEAQPAAKTTETVSISLVDAARCQGNVSGWVNLPWAVQPDCQTAHLSLDLHVEPWYAPSSYAVASPSFSPPLPPPRCG